MKPTPAGLSKALRKLGALKFFPSAPGALDFLTEKLSDSCESDEQLERVTGYILATCDEYPGPRTFSTIIRDALPSRVGDGTDPYGMLVAPRKDSAD